MSIPRLVGHPIPRAVSHVKDAKRAPKQDSLCIDALFLFTEGKSPLMFALVFLA